MSQVLLPVAFPNAEMAILVAGWARPVERKDAQLSYLLSYGGKSPPLRLRFCTCKQERWYPALGHHDG